MHDIGGRAKKGGIGGHCWVRGDGFTYNMSLRHMLLFNCYNAIVMKGDHSKLWVITTFNS